MLKRIGAEESGEFKAIASGTLSSGKPVVVNSDGTVSVVSTTTLTEAKGSNVEFESGAARNQAIVYDSNSDRVVIFYKDENNSNFGTAIVGTVSGDSISFGTPGVFQSSASDNMSEAAVFDSSNNKVVVAFRDTGDSNKGKAVVGTVDSSDNSISFGSAVQFEAGNTQHISMSFDSSANKVVIAYRDTSDSGFGRAIVGTVSGTSISFGSANAFNGSTTTHISIAYDVANNKHVVGYVATSGLAKVATVTGTSITFGSSAEFESGTTILTRAVYDPNIERVHIFYADGGDNDKGKAVIGSVSGTSISFTGQSTFYDSAQVTNIGVSFNSSINKITVSTKDNGGTLNMFTTSATTSAFTHGSAFAIDASITTGEIPHAHVATANKTVLAFTDGGDSSKGKAVVYTGAGDVKNLTSENYIGISRGVAVQTGDAASVGSDSVFESASTQKMDGEVSTFDSSNNKVVIAYRDAGNSNVGTAVVGTVSGSSISFGTPVVFRSAVVDYIATTFDSSNNKVVIAYRDIGSAGRGKAVVGTVSGTSISFGSSEDFSTATEVEYVSATFDSNSNKVVISWNDKGNNSEAGTSVVGTVSGTSISFGSAEVFAAPVTRDISSTFDSNSNKVVVAYRDVANSSHGTAVVGTVSGTSISFGSEVVFEASEISVFTSTTFDSSNNKVVIVTRHPTTDAGQAYVGTVSGTSISFGSVVEFTDGSSNDTRLASAVFDTNLNKVVIAYVNSNTEISAISGTVSGTSISFGSQSTVKTGNNLDNLSAAFDSNSNKVVVSYRDVNNSNHGTSNVFTPSTIATTRDEVASGQAASMDIIGSLSDNQIGLTAGQQYFVQNDGTLSETADSPSVLAGTAISATELLVKT